MSPPEPSVAELVARFHATRNQLDQTTRTIAGERRDIVTTLLGRGMSPDEVAAELGVSRSRVYAIVGGVRK